MTTSHPSGCTTNERPPVLCQPHPQPCSQITCALPEVENNKKPSLSASPAPVAPTCLFAFLSDCLHEIFLYTGEEAVDNGPHVGHNLQPVRENLKWLIWQRRHKKSTSRGREGQKQTLVGDAATDHCKAPSVPAYSRQAPCGDSA